MVIVAGVIAAVVGIQPSVAAEFDARQAAGDAVERVVLLDLRLRRDTAPEDYLLAARLFELAQELEPSDAGLVRRTIAAAWSAGETGLVESQTRKLVKLDPRDTVAQLRLLTGRIAAMQTVEERLHIYDILLGQRGGGIDPSVRSRLALDAALLLRETGNVGGFAEKLALALQLDETNKDAAALAARFYADRIDNPSDQMELLVNLLYADPVDPQVHAAIAKSLGQHGAFEQSRRFFRLTSTIGERAGAPTAQRRMGELLLTWLIDGPEPVVQSLTSELRGLRLMAEAKHAQAEELDLPLENYKKPEDVRLEFDMESLRALAADAAGDRELLRESMTDMEMTMRVYFQSAMQARQAAKTPEHRRAISEQLFGRFSRVQALRAIVGMDVDKAAAETELTREAIPGMAERLRGLRVWEVLHAEGPEQALEVSEELGLGEVSVLSRGVALEMLGRTDEAIELYRRTGQSLFGDPIGAWAFGKVEQLGDHGATLTDHGRRMGAFVEKIPAWFDRMIESPGSFMMVRAQPPGTQIAAAHNPTMRIEIQNLAPIPLGFGSDRTISSRLLLAPGLDQSVGGFEGVPQPEVIELDQRLRLRPRETIIVDVPAEPGYTGWLLDTQAHLTVRQRWRLVQDFQISPSGTVVHGPLALSADTPNVVRRALPEARLSADELVLRIEKGNTAALRGALLGVLAQMVGPSASGRELDDATEVRLADAIGERFAAGTPIERALILAIAPTGRQGGGMELFDDRARAMVASGETGTLVAALTLLTRTTDPEDAALTAILSESSNPALVDIARVVRARLGGDLPHYASVGPGVEAMAGPTPASIASEQ